MEITSQPQLTFLLGFQIRADDTLGDPPYHTNTSQLVIQLEDVNNTPPTLRLVSIGYSTSIVVTETIGTINFNK